jgi:hypothetical protein
VSKFNDYFGEPVARIDEVTYFLARTGKLWAVARLHGLHAWTHLGNPHAEAARLRQSARRLLARARGDRRHQVKLLLTAQARHAAADAIANAARMEVPHAA